MRIIQEVPVVATFKVKELSDSGDGNIVASFSGKMHVYHPSFNVTEIKCRFANKTMGLLEVTKTKPANGYNIISFTGSQDCAVHEWSPISPWASPYRILYADLDIELCPQNSSDGELRPAIVPLAKRFVESHGIIDRMRASSVAPEGRLHVTRV